MLRTLEWAHFARVMSSFFTSASGETRVDTTISAAVIMSQVQHSGRLLQVPLVMAIERSLMRAASYRVLSVPWSSS